VLIFVREGSNRPYFLLGGLSRKFTLAAQNTHSWGINRQKKLVTSSLESGEVWDCRGLKREKEGKRGKLESNTIAVWPGGKRERVGRRWQSTRRKKGSQTQKNVSGIDDRRADKLEVRGNQIGHGISRGRGKRNRLRSLHVWDKGNDGELLFKMGKKARARTIGKEESTAEVQLWFWLASLGGKKNVGGPKGD